MRFAGGAVLILSLAAGNLPAVLCAADIANGWSQTQVDGGGIQRGDPITLRWSIVPDGESYERSSNSDLIDFLDDGWNVAAVDRTPSLTNRPWWDVINSAYEQYNGVSGLNMVYRPEQTGAGQDTGNEGDIRIGGEIIDNDPGGVLGDNVFPNGGDMRIDTSRDSNGNPGGIFTNAAPLRNLISHESGHGVGLGHTEISGADAVMESGLQDHFFGLQFDDIYGFNRLYGDPYEKIGGGNDSSTAGLNLGTFSAKTSVSYGTDAGDSVVNQGEHDWLGIDGATDQDWFRFTVPRAAVVDVTVTPMGPAYQLSGQSFSAAAQSDLEFDVYRSDNSLVRTANQAGLGEVEQVQSLTLLEPGEYFVRVQGNEDRNQFYQIDVNAELPDLLLTVNHDTGDVHMSGLASGAGFDGYRIESPLGGLNPSNEAWQSFQDQNRGDWVEANPTSTSIQELLPAGADHLGTSDSVYLGNFYTQKVSEPFGTPQPEDLTFSYLAPGSGDTWLKGAVEFLGTPVQNNLVLTIDPSTGEATVTNQSNTTVHLDGYSIASDSASLDPQQWSSFADQMISNWTEANPNANALSELKPGGTMALLPGDVYALGKLFKTTGTQDVEFSFLHNGDSDFTGAVVLYDTPAEPTLFDLVLTVDPTTGEAALANLGSFDIAIDGYSIASQSESLDVAGWSSLQDQMLADWVEANPDSSVLTELKSAGSLVLAPGEFLQLGALFNALGMQDLELSFLLEGDDAFRLGAVDYQISLAGDYDRDGDVDTDDYEVWRLAFGGSANQTADGNRDGIIDMADFAIWRDNLGETSGVTTGALTAVPEQSSAGLLCVAITIVGCFRLHRSAALASSLII